MSEQEPSAPEVTKLGARHGVTYFAVVGFGAVVVVLVLISFFTFKYWDGRYDAFEKQEQLNPFYTPPPEDQMPKESGVIIRTEPMTNVNLPGGTSYRVLYSSEGPKGETVAVSGMFWIPTAPAPPEGRKVLAWAHGTVGLAPQCAPSRSANPLGDTNPWLNLAMQKGWAVAATDYLGLGTPGPKTYLVGGQEARDVANSVRALRSFAPAQAGDKWIVWGHSQGGHSALWTGALGQQIAPEMKLLGVGAAAPADELLVIMQNQWQSTIGWVIGPEAAVSFQENYPDRDFLSSITKVGQREMNNLEQACTLGAGLTGLTYERFNAQFFTENPLDVPAWAQTAIEQTPPVLPSSMPLFMAEGTNDTVVLSGSNALMQNQWCAAGSDMSVQWQGQIGHLQVATTAGPAFDEWATAVFDGKKPPKNCAYPPASPPLPAVYPPASSLVGWQPNYPTAHGGDDHGKPPAGELPIPGVPSGPSPASTTATTSPSASPKPSKSKS